MCPGVDSASKIGYQDTPGGEDGRCVGVTTLPPSQYRKSWKSGALTYRIPKGLVRPVVGHLYLFREIHLTQPTPCYWSAEIKNSWNCISTPPREKIFLPSISQNLLQLTCNVTKHLTFRSVLHSAQTEAGLRYWNRQSPKCLQFNSPVVLDCSARGRFPHFFSRFFWRTRLTWQTPSHGVCQVSFTFFAPRRCNVLSWPCRGLLLALQTHI
jgi:hypothetical protein